MAQMLMTLLTAKIVQLDPLALRELVAPDNLSSNVLKVITVPSAPRIHTSSHALLVPTHSKLTVTQTQVELLPVPCVTLDSTVNKAALLQLDHVLRVIIVLLELRPHSPTRAQLAHMLISSD